MSRLAAPTTLPPTTADPPRGGVVDRWLRGRLLDRLDSLRHGVLRIDDALGTKVCGEAADDGLTGHVRIEDARFHRRVALGGSLGAAESYLDGDWDADDVVAVLRILLRNLDALERLNRGRSWLTNAVTRLGHWASRNTRDGSRRNIAAHYDLGNDFYRLFLDERMMYSSAIFEDETTTLEQASVAKLDRICRRLDLGPNDHVVEIGTGWGGFALHATREYGCRVTTTTISGEQHRFARGRIREAGLGDRVTLLERDYRDLDGGFDKLVSIEMIEAVGHAFLDGYFAACDRLLRPGGTMLVQAITMPEGRYAGYLKSVDFIQKYVFPGGCLPSVAAMQEAAGRGTSLRLTGLDDFGLDYARTLREWRRRFEEQLPAVRDLGFDERFVRLWRYYLSYCEAAFLERAVGVSHLVWTKPEYGSER